MGQNLEERDGHAVRVEERVRLPQVRSAPEFTVEQVRARLLGLRQADQYPLDLELGELGGSRSLSVESHQAERTR